MSKTVRLDEEIIELIKGKSKEELIRLLQPKAERYLAKPVQGTISTENEEPLEEEFIEWEPSKAINRGCTQPVSKNKICGIMPTNHITDDIYLCESHLQTLNQCCQKYSHRSNDAV